MTDTKERHVMKLLRKLLGLCEHEFEIVATGHIRHSDGESLSGDWYDCRCKKCGRMKRYNLRVR